MHLKSLAEYVVQSGIDITKQAQYGGNPAIKEMQQSIQALVTAVNKYSGTDIRNPNQFENKDYGARRSSRDSFSNFIIDHYITEKALQKPSVGGKEYTSDQNKIKRDEKDPSKQMRMQGVMDTVFRLGAEAKGGKERLPDGVWEFRTHNALRNVYSFIQSIINLIKDFQLTPKADINLTAAELNDFGSFVKPDDKKYTFQQKVAKAPVLSEYIKKATELYDWAKEMVLTLPAYKSFIDEKQALTTYQPHDQYGGIQFSDAEKVIFDQVKSNAPQAAKYTSYSTLPQIDINGTKYTVTLKDLFDKASFAKWKQTNNITLENDQLIDKIKEAFQNNLKVLQQYAAVTSRRSKGKQSVLELNKDKIDQLNSLVTQYNNLLTKTTIQSTSFGRPAATNELFGYYMNGNRLYDDEKQFLFDNIKSINSIAYQIDSAKKSIEKSGYGDLVKNFRAPAILKLER